MIPYYINLCILFGILNFCCMLLNVQQQIFLAYLGRGRTQQNVKQTMQKYDWNGKMWATTLSATRKV